MMIATEFKETTKRLGLTPQWFLKLSENKIKIKDVVDWQEGRVPIPEYIIFYVEGLDSAVELAVENQLEAIDQMIEDKQPPTAITLVRYRNDNDLWQYRDDLKGLPVEYHSYMLHRIQKALKERGVMTFFEYHENKEYEIWLRGRENSDALRSEWICHKTGRK